MEIINHITMIDDEARISRLPHLKAEMVARMYVDGDYTITGVMEHYGLTAGEVHSAIAYYYDNQQALDEAYQKALAQVRKHAMTLEDLRAELKARQGNESD